MLIHEKFDSAAKLQGEVGAAKIPIVTLRRFKNRAGPLEYGPRPMCALLRRCADNQVDLVYFAKLTGL